MTTTHDRPGTAEAAAAAAPPSTSPATPPSMARTALTLGAFVALGPLTIDMYLPALPTVADDLMTTSCRGGMIDMIEASQYLDDFRARIGLPPARPHRP